MDWALSSTDTTWTPPTGTFTLERFDGDTSPVRAWDAADDYAITHAVDQGLGPGARVLVVNDGFGALATASAAVGAVVTSWSDSVVATRAAARNLVANDLSPDAVTWVPSTETPVGPFDLVIIKVPKTLRHLETQLRMVAPQLTGATVVGAGMTKSIHLSTIAAFEHTIGPTPTSLARRKARLLLPTADPALVPPDPEPPRTWTTPDGLTVINFANVFSGERLDRGTAVLLAHLPRTEPGAVVIDLGCGNGVVGATLARRVPQSTVWCCDESHHAVAAARATVGAVTDAAEFRVTDALDGVPDGIADLVVINPPFHAGGNRTHAVAARMFRDARRVLRPGGTVCVVGNRHLGYHAVLKRQFHSVAVVSHDDQFVVVTGTA